MKITIEKITPKLAEDILKNCNINNRTIRQAHVNFLANEMAQGRFHQTGQSISFFADGTLANGQHRLSAIVQSGVTIEIPVARGVKKEAMAGIDIGPGRTVAEHLHLHHGVRDANMVTATARAIINFNSSYQSYVLPAEIILKVLERFGNEIGETIEEVRNFKTARKAWIIGPIAFARKNFPKEIKEFSQGVSSGELIVKGDPAHTCRNWLIEGSASALKQNYKRPATEMLFNLMHKAVKQERVFRVFAGAPGVSFFTAHERRFIEQIRSEIPLILK